MQIDLTGITETEVSVFTAELEADGFTYDEDYTTLYGAEWAITGIRFMSSVAAMQILTRYAETERLTRAVLADAEDS